MNYLRHLILTYNKNKVDITKPYWFTYFLKFSWNPFNVNVSRWHLTEHFENDINLFKNFHGKQISYETIELLNEHTTYVNNTHNDLYKQYRTEELDKFYETFMENMEKNKDSIEKFRKYNLLKVNKENPKEFLYDEEPNTWEINNLLGRDFIYYCRKKQLEEEYFINEIFSYNWNTEKYFSFRKEKKHYTRKKNFFSLVDNINIYFLRKERLYTKLKYSRVASFDIVSGGFAAFFAGFIGFLVLEKFGIEMPDSGDFWYLVMYVAFIRFIYKALSFGWNKENSIFYMLSWRMYWDYFFDLYYILATLLTYYKIKYFYVDKAKLADYEDPADKKKYDDDEDDDEKFEKKNNNEKDNKN